MLTKLLCVSVMCVSGLCLAAPIADRYDAYLFAHPELHNVSPTYSGDGLELMGLTVDGVDRSDLISIIEAITDAQVATWRASVTYPAPEVTAPLIAGSNQLGTASLYVDAETMMVCATTNTASPRRTASQQAAERAARKAAIAAAKAKPHGNLQERIERLEAILTLLTGGE